MGTLTSNSSLAFSEIESEFDMSTDSVLGLNEYYDADPYHEVPVSGTISVDDLRGTSKQTVRIEPGSSSDSAKRYGFSEYQGSSYYVAESGESAAAFGMESRTADVLTDTTDIRGIVCEYGGRYQAETGFGPGAGQTTYGTTAGLNLLISINSSSSTGWSNCSAFTDSMPIGPGSIYNPFGGGGTSTWNVSGYNYSATTTANTVYTIPRTKYMTLSSASGGAGNYAMYHFKALSNTSPTAYGMHFSQAWDQRYNPDTASFNTGHQNKHRHAAQMLYCGAWNDDINGTGTNEVYFYFY